MTTPAERTRAVLMVEKEAMPTNTNGVGYGCACVHRSARLCAQIRYYSDDTDETGDDACECSCHGWYDDEDDYE